MRATARCCEWTNEGARRVGLCTLPPPRRETRAFGFTEGLDMIRHIEPRIERDVYRYTFIGIINVSDTQITRDLTEYQS